MASSSLPHSLRRLQGQTQDRPGAELQKSRQRRPPSLTAPACWISLLLSSRHPLLSPPPEHPLLSIPAPTKLGSSSGSPWHCRRISHMQPPMSGRTCGAVARWRSSSPAAMVSRMLGVPSSSSSLSLFPGRHRDARRSREAHKRRLGADSRARGLGG
jgi:hypothetical protein